MLYENQQIGNFNYLLGYYLGQNNFQKPFSINTYQQTHGHDKTVGDMFGNLGGKYFILEFKRTRDKYLDEFKKKHRNKLIAQLQTNPKLGALSKKGHFLCHSEEYHSCHLESKKEYIFSDYHFCPYIELISGVAGNYKPVITSMDEFTLNIAFDIIRSDKQPVGMNYEELKEYLDMMKECVGDDDYETTGTVACFNSELGNMVTLKFESLQELEKQLNLRVEHFHEIGNLLDIERPKSQLPPSKNRDSGLSM